MNIQTLDSIYNRMVWISRGATWFGGASMLILSIVITIEVFLRKYADFSIQGVQEFSTYAFAGATTLAMSHCLLHRANVRIDTLYVLLPKAIAAILDVIGLILLLCVMSITTYYCAGVFKDSWQLNSMSISGVPTPLWIPQFFWIAGFVLFLFALTFILFYSLVACFRRNWNLVAKLAGIPSINEVVSEDIRVDI